MTAPLDDLTDTILALFASGLGWEDAYASFIEDGLPASCASISDAELRDEVHRVWREFHQVSRSEAA